MQSVIKDLPYIKTERNPPTFKMLDVWLKADLAGCEEISYIKKKSL